MIGKLKGRVDELFEDAVLIDVGGVGYYVFASGRTLAGLSTGSAAALIIETHVREDHIHLYGFASAAERDWFRLLNTVQRVGAKMALTILGAYGPDQLTHAIMAKDTSVFSRISGVGPKLAERIVAELKDKVPSAELRVLSKERGKNSALGTQHSQLEDAISALVNLGYSRSDAYSAALKAAGTGRKPHLDDLIKLSLKELAHG